MFDIIDLFFLILLGAFFVGFVVIIMKFYFVNIRRKVLLMMYLKRIDSSVTNHLYLHEINFNDVYIFDSDRKVLISNFYHTLFHFQESVKNSIVLMSFDEITEINCILDNNKIFSLGLELDFKKIDLTSSVENLQIEIKTKESCTKIILINGPILTKKGNSKNDFTNEIIQFIIDFNKVAFLSILKPSLINGV